MTLMRCPSLIESNQVRLWKKKFMPSELVLCVYKAPYPDPPNMGRAFKRKIKP